MPNPNAIVSKNIRVEAPPESEAAEFVRAEGGLSVELDEGRRVRLDPANPMSAGFAQVLDGLSKLGRPAYVEVDPESEAVTRLLIPHVAHVVGVEPGEAGFDVELDASHARHLLRRDRPDFADLERALREALDRKALVILTEDDSGTIIDIRFFKPGPDDGPFRLPDVRPFQRNWVLDFLYWIWWWPIWPWWWLFGRWWWWWCVSPARAQQIFDAMKAQTCNPNAIASPCIPFLYPEDGCWGRAHEMCRLMIQMGHIPRKVWIQHSAGHWLHVDTANSPNCGVTWGWHVAPTLCVRNSWWWSQRMVIDPSLFDTPVTEATWKGVQGDPGASLTPTAWTMFWLWPNGYYPQQDPGYVYTNQVLATYRLNLQNRVNQHGPPPYNCP